MEEDFKITLLENEKTASFYVGEGYYCRIIKGHSEEKYAEYINDLHYEEDIWLWNAQQGMHRPPKTEASEEELVKYDGSDIWSEIENSVKQKFLSSWLLARLWHITDGAILGAIQSVNEEREGFVDGGDLYAYLLVVKDEDALGVLEISGSQHLSYGSIKLVRRSETVKAQQMEVFYRSFGSTLLKEPQELAICSITIKDPELSGYPWKYGWDGHKLLRYAEEEVLQWYTENGLDIVRTFIERALKDLKEQPLHHLQRGIREAIIREIRIYIEKHCTFAISRPAFRQKLRMNVLYKILYLWKETWPNNNRADMLMQKFYKLLEASTNEESKQIMSNWEEDWKYMKQWAEQTYIKDMQHRLHRFPQAMVGLAVARCMKESEEELFKDTHIKKDIEEKINVSSKEALNRIYNKVDTLEEFYAEDMYFYAACAYAGGTPYSMEGFEIEDAQKYHEFWRWWLLEAIPQSMPPADI